MVRTNLFGLVVCWVVALIGLNVTATLPPTISFYVTVRDFMAQACRPNTVDSISGGSDTARDYWCPNVASIKAEVKSNTASSITGHPDFQRNTFVPSPTPTPSPRSATPLYNIENNPVVNYPGDFPVTCAPSPACGGSRTKPVVTQKLVEDSAGIPLMQYCTATGCDIDGVAGNTARSVYNANSFSTWHKDDPRFSIRSGYKQTLYKGANPSVTYSFDSFSDSNGFFCPLTRYGLPSWSLSQGEVAEGLAGTFGKNFWFTTEIHTSFQYRGNEQFAFTGDDDVHIFINNKLAINLGGLHPKVGASIVLSDHAAPNRLNLTEGQIYQFDMFHAERQISESNFKMDTTLGETCNVITTDLRTNGLNVENGIDWRKAGGTTNNSEWIFISGPGYGYIELPSKEALLMKANVPNVASYMFFRQQQNAGSGFSFSFKFKADGTGHGFAVLFHDRDLGLQDFNGGTGPNLGIKNTDNSFAIVFDMCPGFPSSQCITPTGNNPRSSIRLHYNVDGDRRNSVASATKVRFDEAVFQKWNDNATHLVEIFYYATPDWLEVYVDNSLRLRKKDFSVEKVIGGKDATVGFSSASSEQGKNMNVRIYDVTMKSVKVVSTKTLPSASIKPADFPLAFTANGRDSVSFAMQTRDACENTIEFGGSPQLAHGRLVATSVSDAPPSSGRRLQEGASLILIPEIVDLNTGEYAIKFKTDVLANFDAHMAFGANCAWNGTAFTANSECWTQTYLAAAVSVPFSTFAPTAEEETSGLGSAALAGIGVAAGVVAVCGTIMIVVGVGIRNRWRRDKRFIDEGKKLVAEKGVAYVGDSELDALQNKLQATMHAINAERAKKMKEEDKQGAIDALLRQKGELQEVVRRLKIAQAGGDPNAPEERMTMGGRVRKSFAASRVSRGPSMRYSRGASVFNQNPNGGEASSSNPIFARLRQSVARPSRPTSKSQALVHQEEPSDV